MEFMSWQLLLQAALPVLGLGHLGISFVRLLTQRRESSLTNSKTELEIKKLKQSLREGL